MINKAKEIFQKELVDNPALASLNSPSRDTTGLPYQRMETFLIQNGPYEFLPTEMGIDCRSQITRELRDFQAKKYHGNALGYGEITLAIGNVVPKNIEALALMYLGGIISDSTPEDVSHMTTEVGDVMLLEDGVVAWFFSSNKIPFSITGFCYPEEMRDKMIYGIPHPENPKIDIPNYMKDELAGYLNGLELADRMFMFEHKQVQKPELGQPCRRPNPEELSEIIHPAFGKPIVKVSVTEIVDYITDTKSFRALPDMIELCLNVYKYAKE